MKKNIAIVVLAVALAACLMQLGNQTLHDGAVRASHRDARLAGFKVWSEACRHAAAGSSARVKWCAVAASQTTISAADEGVSVDDYKSLALEGFQKRLEAQPGVTAVR